MQEEQTTTRGRRRSKTGTVISNAMDKTVVVKVERTMRHPRLGKVIQRYKKYYAHDADNACQVGDHVEIIECRPMSKTKSWRVAKA
jgi:small subunit ribosomal protein S17